MSLEVENLSFSYDAGDLHFCGTALLENIVLQVPPGSIMHISGRNGTGKTTLLKIIAGILSPCAGDVKYNGRSIFAHSYDYKNTLCYVGHKLGVNLQLTALENCYFDLRNSKTQFEISQLLKSFNLATVQDKIVGQLSAGQKKRLSLLRVLLAKTKIWILDEPFTALDGDFIKFFVEHMRLHVMNGGIIIYTSHQAVLIDGVMHYECSL